MEELSVVSGFWGKILTVLGLVMHTVICELQPWSKLSVVSGIRGKVLAVLGLVMNIVICEWVLAGLRFLLSWDWL